MITEFGYFSIGVLLFTVFLTLRILKRLKDKGCFAYGYIFLVVFSVISIFLSSSYMSLKSMNAYITGENYEGKIIAYKSYEKEYKDSNDNYRKKTSILYISIIEFIDSTNQKKQLESNIHSDTVPIVGEKISISYLKGETTVLEQSIGAFMLLLVGVAFAIIFGFFSVGILKYAFGYNIGGFKDQFAKGLFQGVKISVLLFAIILIKPIYSHLNGQSLMPTWAFIISGYTNLASS